VIFQIICTVNTGSKELVKHRRTPQSAEFLPSPFQQRGKRWPTWFSTHLHQGKWEVRWIVWKGVLRLPISSGQARPHSCIVWQNCRCATI